MNEDECVDVDSLHTQFFLTLGSKLAKESIGKTRKDKAANPAGYRLCHILNDIVTIRPRVGAPATRLCVLWADVPSDLTSADRNSEEPSCDHVTDRARRAVESALSKHDITCKEWRSNCTALLWVDTSPVNHEETNLSAETHSCVSALSSVWRDAINAALRQALPHTSIIPAQELTRWDPSRLWQVCTASICFNQMMHNVSHHTMRGMSS